MEGRKKPHTDKCKGITNDWNYDAKCKLTFPSGLGLSKFQMLVHTDTDILKTFLTTTSFLNTVCMDLYSFESNE
jgi:hypothetical protein